MTPGRPVTAALRIAGSLTILGVLGCGGSGAPGGPVIPDAGGQPAGDAQTDAPGTGGTGGGGQPGSGGASGTGGAASGGESGSGGTGSGGMGLGGSGSGGGGVGGNGGGAIGGGGSGGGGGAGGGRGGDGGHGSGGTAGAGAGGQAGSPMGPRCSGVAPTCGPTGASDCCASALVPGGTFNRDNNAAYPATISDFRLDTYEVTVGRFRQFIAGYAENLPASGSGKNPNNPADTGWDAAWNASLPADVAALRDRFRACGERTWTDTPGDNEALPINCLSWFEAFAFCVWDQGRLPTEAEWNYAAAGGAEQRTYPWSVPPSSTTIDKTYATYDGPVAPVGSKSPKGDGRWGHADLSGGVFEWVQDFSAVYPVPCVDCAVLGPVPTPALRGDRGGSYWSVPIQLMTSYRGQVMPAQRQGNLGVRCARQP